MTHKKSPSPGSSKKSIARAASLEEARIRRSLESTTLHRAMSRADLPLIPAPSLEGLRVQVPALGRPSPQDLEVALKNEVLERLPRRNMADGEPLQGGELVSLDVIAYSNGVLLPELSQGDAQFILDEHSLLPGFGEKLLGAKVGSQLQVQMTLPPDYDIAPLRGAPVVVAVKVRTAFELLPPAGEFSDPAFLTALGLPPKVDEAMGLIAKKLLAEQQLLQQRLVMDTIMEQLRARAPVSIPDAAVDATLGALWTEAQDRFLVQSNVALEDREFAAKAWLDNAEMREQIRQRQHTWLIYSAIALEHHLDRYKWEELEAFVRSMASAAGLSPDEAAKGLKTEPDYAGEMGRQFIYFRAADLVRKKAVVEETAAPRG